MIINTAFTRSTNQYSTRYNDKEREILNKGLNPNNKPFENVAVLFTNKKNKDIAIDFGLVENVFPDDLHGIKHQLFNLRLDGGLKVKVAHNIDLAPRVPELQKGQRLGIKGEFIHRDQLKDLGRKTLLSLGINYQILSSIIDDPTMAGLLHWTHHDPAKKHENGGMVVFTPGENYGFVIT